MITWTIHYHNKLCAIEDREKLIERNPGWHISNLYLDHGYWAIKCTEDIGGKT